MLINIYHTFKVSRLSSPYLFKYKAYNNKMYTCFHMMKNIPQILPRAGI